jgi:hypothetical protein
LFSVFGETVEKRQNWNGKDNDKMPCHAAASNGLNLLGNFTFSTANSTFYDPVL